MNRLSSILNRYESATAIGVLNSDGRLSAVPPEVKDVVSRALYHFNLTGGAFDITVKPVVDLFKDRYDKKMDPKIPEHELEKVLKLVDSNGILFDNRKISFSQPGMGLTLDGIAKGYIVDRVSEFLEKRGVCNHLVNAGGDIRTNGTRTDGKPWSVAIEDPEKRKEYPDIIRMRNGAVATSGNYEIFFDREKMVHHLVNPQSGLSPVQSTSVSVRAKIAMDADALATGVFVMGKEKGTRLINSLPGCDSLVIDRDGKRLRSRGWKKTATI
jgi:thiamine biosynthesis lipoprotein